MSSPTSGFPSSEVARKEWLEHVDLRDVFVIPQGPKCGLHKGRDSLSFGPQLVGPPFVHHHRGYGVASNVQELLKAEVDGFEKLRGKYFYGGPFDYHVGHFIAECLGRLWFWEAAGKSKILYCPTSLSRTFSWTRELPQWQIEVLSYCGLSISDLVFVESPVQVETLTIAEQGSFLNGIPHPNFLSWLGVRQERFLKNKIATNLLPKKVFVSRGRLNFVGRRIVGIEKIVERFKLAGYEVVFPEELSIESQLAIYCHASKLIFEAGSSLHILELLAEIRGQVAILPRVRSRQAQTGSGRGFRRMLAPRCRTPIWTYSGPAWMDDSDLLVSDQFRRTNVDVSRLLHEIAHAGFLE